jgi:hypothetical protein
MTTNHATFDGVTAWCGAENPTIRPGGITCDGCLGVKNRD